MPLSLSKIFNPEPGAVAKLRVMDKTNRDDLKLPVELSEKGQFARDNRHARLVAFSGKMCVSTAEEFVASHISSLGASAWEEAAQHASDMIRAQIVERTRELLIAALHAVMESLRTEQARVTKAAMAEGEKLGVEVGAEDSPIFRALAAKSKQAKDHLTKFTNEDSVAFNSYGELQTAVDFVLNS